MSGFAIVLGFLAVGIVLRGIQARVALLPEASAEYLIKYVLYIAMPALVLLHLPELKVDASLWVPVMTPWAMLILSMLSVAILAKVFSWPRPVLGALLIVVPLGNTSFLGFPIVRSFYGNEGLAYAVLYDQFGSFIGLAVIATTLAAIFGRPGAEGAPQIGAIIKKVLTFPPFLALVAALAVLASGIEYAPALAGLLQILGLTLVPAVMIAVGLQLKFIVPREELGPFTAALSLKLIVLPAVALASMWALQMSGLAVKVSLLEAAMPPMITAGAIAMAAGLRPGLVSAIIGYGVLASVVTLPMWYIAIERLF